MLLETSPIERITPTGVRTEDGVEHEVDVLVLATGFKVFEKGNMPAFSVTGAGGVDLESWWEEHRFQAYQGVSVPGFPNFFAILGPYGYNGSSYFNLIETQMAHIVRCLRRARRTGATRVEVTSEANARYFEHMLGRRKHQVFFQPSCATRQQLLLRRQRRRAVPRLAHARDDVDEQPVRPRRLPVRRR